MAKYTVLERDGVYTVANGNRSKHWSRTASTCKAEVEAIAAHWNARHHLAEAKKHFDKIDSLENINALFELGHQALEFVDCVTATHNDQDDPRGWTC